MTKSGVSKKPPEKILYYSKKNYQTALSVLKLLSKDELLSTNKIAEKIGKKWPIPHGRAKLLLKYLSDLEYIEELGFVSNKNHICENCKKSTGYYVSISILESALETLSKNKKAQQLAKKEKDYDKKMWFNCKQGYVLGRLIWLVCHNCNTNVDAHKDEEYKIQQDKYWRLSQNGKIIMLAVLTKKSLFKFLEKNSSNEIMELLLILLKEQKKDWIEIFTNSIRSQMKIDPEVLSVANNRFIDLQEKISRTKIDKKNSKLLYNYKESNKMKWKIQKNLRPKI